jgi:hypothetical protein
MNGKTFSARRGSSSWLLRAVRAIIFGNTRLSRLDLVGPSMLCFPVSLLTATALVESIKRVIRRRLSFVKLNAPAESPKSTSDCPMRDAAPGGALQSIVEHESSEVESEILCKTSAVFMDIRKVLGFSTVGCLYVRLFFYILTHLRRRLMSVRDGSNWCDWPQRSQFARSTF